MITSAPSRLEHALNYRLATNRNDFVYVIKCCEFTKIGIAYDVKLRMSQMQIGNPFKLTLLASWRSPNAIAEEEEIHAFFESKRERGEWFKLSEADMVVLMAMSLRS